MDNIIRPFDGVAYCRSSLGRWGLSRRLRCRFSPSLGSRQEELICRISWNGHDSFCGGAEPQYGSITKRSRRKNRFCRVTEISFHGTKIFSKRGSNIRRHPTRNPDGQELTVTVPLKRSLSPIPKDRNFTVRRGSARSGYSRHGVPPNEIPCVTIDEHRSHKHQNKNDMNIGGLSSLDGTTR
jgi:hypothetical protein